MTDRSFVVEADGGSRGNPGPAAYGALVRDAESREILVEIAEHIGVATNNVAEYRGLIAGLERARELDPDAPVEARMDSKLVVEQMSGRWKIKHESMKPLALAAQRLAGRGGRVSYTWVPRERNKDADRLANEALDAAARGQVWLPRAVRASSGSAARVGPAGGPASTEPTSPDPQPDPQPAPPNVLVGFGDALPTPTTFVLVRHGATAHTAQKRFSGWGGADPGLSDEGRRQAELLAATVARRGGIDAVVSSPMLRARETAELVAVRLGTDVRVDEGFRECSFGDWDGLTLAEVRVRWPDELAAWLSSTAVNPPGGESYDDAGARARVARDRTVARHAGLTVLVVSHVTPISQLVCAALGAPPSSVFRLQVDPTSLSVVSWWPDGASSLRSLNETVHLR